jgi:CheY-like chemotaxis protein
VQPSDGATPRRILVVDDQEDVADLLAAMLEAMGQEFSREDLALVAVTGLGQNRAVAQLRAFDHHTSSLSRRTRLSSCSMK